MTKMVLVSVVFASLPAWAALPPSPTVCQFPRKVTSAREITSLPQDQIQWGCLNLSSLQKNDLLAVAELAPSLSIRLSESPLNKTDLMDAQLKTKVTVVVNSRRFNRIDIQDLQRAGVAVSVQTFGLSLTAADYQEIARTGPLTLEINSKTLTKQEILSLAGMDGVKVSVDPLTSGLSGADLQEIAAVVTK